MIASIASAFVIPFTVLKAGPAIIFDEKAVALPNFSFALAWGFRLLFVVSLI